MQQHGQTHAPTPGVEIYFFQHNKTKAPMFFVQAIAKPNGHEVGHKVEIQITPTRQVKFHDETTNTKTLLQDKAWYHVKLGTVRKLHSHPLLEPSATRPIFCEIHVPLEEDLKSVQFNWVLGVLHKLDHQCQMDYLERAKDFVQSAMKPSLIARGKNALGGGSGGIGLSGGSGADCAFM